jgi:hypothetical protein
VLYAGAADVHYGAACRAAPSSTMLPAAPWAAAHDEPAGNTPAKSLAAASS